MKFSKLFLKLIASILATTFFITSTAFATSTNNVTTIDGTTINTNSLPENMIEINSEVIEEMQSGNIKFDGYSVEDFEAALEIYNQLNTDQQAQNKPMSRSLAVGGAILTAGAGVYFIVGVGIVMVTVFWAVYLYQSNGYENVPYGTWLYFTINTWFAAANKIPKKLKTQDGNIDLGKFTEKVSGNSVKYKDPKSGWSVEKDTAGHGGREWKLKDKNGNRVGSLDGSGRILAD